MMQGYRAPPERFDILHRLYGMVEEFLIPHSRRQRGNGKIAGFPVERTVDELDTAVPDKIL
jgi:hypothetical protein